MNVIDINIGNKSYQISCNPGEESTIAELSKKIDEKYKTLHQTFGDKASNDLILVIIALMLQDESKEGTTPAQTAPNTVEDSSEIKQALEAAANENKLLKEALKESAHKLDSAINQLQRLKG